MTKQHKTEAKNIEYLNTLYVERNAITAQIESFYEHEIAMQGVEITDELYKEYWKKTHSKMRGLADDVDSVKHELVLENIYFSDVDAWVAEMTDDIDKLSINF